MRPRLKLVLAHPLPTTTMSTTEVYTVENLNIQGQTSSSTSIHIYPPNPPEPSHKPVKKGGDVELADMTRAGDSSLGGNTPPSQESDPTETKVPWWRPQLQFAACCASLFVAGWNDGSTGPLLPRIQSNYHVRLLVYLVCAVVYSRPGRIRRRLANIRLQLRCKCTGSALSCFIERCFS